MFIPYFYSKISKALEGSKWNKQEKYVDLKTSAQTTNISHILHFLNGLSHPHNSDSDGDGARSLSLSTRTQRFPHTVKHPHNNGDDGGDGVGRRRRRKRRQTLSSASRRVTLLHLSSFRFMVSAGPWAHNGTLAGNHISQVTRSEENTETG